MCEGTWWREQRLMEENGEDGHGSMAEGQAPESWVQVALLGSNIPYQLDHRRLVISDRISETTLAIQLL